MHSRFAVQNIDFCLQLIFFFSSCFLLGFFAGINNLNCSHFLKCIFGEFLDVEKLNFLGNKVITCHRSSVLFYFVLVILYITFVICTTSVRVFFLLYSIHFLHSIVKSNKCYKNIYKQQRNYALTGKIQKRELFKCNSGDFRHYVYWLINWKLLL